MAALQGSRGAPAGSKEEDEADSEADSKANQRPHPMKNRAHAEARPILLAWRPIEGRADCDPPGSTPNRLADNPQVPGATPKGRECLSRGLGPNRKKRAHAEAGSTNPRRTRASAEALPKNLSLLAAAPSPMKTRAEARAPMVGCGTTAAQGEEAIPGWNGPWDEDPIVAEAIKVLTGDDGVPPDLDYRGRDYDPHHIVAEAITALTGDDGVPPDLTAWGVTMATTRARAIAALRDNTMAVDPHNPSNEGGASSLAAEESEEKDDEREESGPGNSWGSSNVDPDDPYGGGCGSSLGSDEVDAHDDQDPAEEYGGGSEAS